MRFSTLLLCILAILLCTAPCACGQLFSLYYDEVGEYDVTVDEINKARGEAGLEKNGVLDILDVGAGTIVNLYASVKIYVTVRPYSVLNIYSGGSVEQSVYVGPYSVLNIYSGSVGLLISINEYADVTVYGMVFEDKLGTVNYGQWTPDDGEETLKVQYNKNTSQINLPILSDIPINLTQPPPSGDLEEITIDIKPGGNPNNINLKSNGVVPVAVLSTDDFDASEVLNPATVLFAGASPVRCWKLCDVDGDGNDDMLFHFKTQKLELDKNSTEATLTGETFDGVEIELTDTVNIVQSKKE